MAHPTTPRAPTQPPPPRPRLRVLVVDDSATLRHHLRHALEHAGLDVVAEAANGHQALTQAATHHPDVVLMDLRMPGMDGIQATQALRAADPTTHVVIWTADSDRHLASALRQSGAHAGLAKGTRTSDLIATLHHVCQAQLQPGLSPG